MKFVIEKAWVDVIGIGWYGQRIGYTYTLNTRDLESIGAQSRTNVAGWLTRNAGDFQRIDDFSAVLKTKRLPWASEQDECEFNDMMFPAEG